MKNLEDEIKMGNLRQKTLKTELILNLIEIKKKRGGTGDGNNEKKKWIRKRSVDGISNISMTTNTPVRYVKVIISIMYP